MALQPATITFLEEAGLPSDAAPFLSFEYCDKPSGCNLKKLPDVIRGLDSGFERFIFIGSTGDGDPIVINTSNNDRIELLDHESRYFTSVFINSNIGLLAECLLIYRNFVEAVNKNTGDETSIVLNFSDEHFNELRQSLFNADIRIEQGGFWKDEMQLLLANRQWEKENNAQ